MTNNPQMTVDFRAADLEAVFGHIHGGQSVEIIGVGSVGKSNFIRRLLRRDVQERYLYDYYGEEADCIFISLDANSLLEPVPSAMNASVPSGWPGYELMASRLLQAVMAFGLVDHITDTNHLAHRNNLGNLYHRLWPDDDAQSVYVIAFRYLEDLIQRIFATVQHPIRLIFILDEFEKFLKELPPRFFQSLRSLRDQYKDRVIYITTARQITPLLVSADQHLAYEPFYELFSDSRHFLLAYRPSDARQTFNRLAARQNYNPPPDALRDQLMAVTGGHAGLLRASFAAWGNGLLAPGMPDGEMVSTLLNVSAIQEECKTIWRSLSEGELHMLFEMVRAHRQNQRTDIKPYQPMARLLIHKGILLETNSMAFENIRPAVLAAFLLSAIPENNMPSFPQRPTF